LHDKAFDRGLISLDGDFRVMVSKELEQRSETFVQQFFIRWPGKPSRCPNASHPTKAFWSGTGRRSFWIMSNERTVQKGCG